MSSKGYAKRWLTAVADSRALIAAEHDVQTHEPITDHIVAQNLMSHLYTRYLLLVNNLNDIYDQMLQCQRRLVIAVLLEVATKRMLEWKQALCELQMSDFIYIDQAMVQQKVIPSRVLLARPQYFPFKRREEVQAMIDGFREAQVVEVIVEDEDALSASEAGDSMASVRSSVELQRQDSVRQSLSPTIQFEFDEDTQPLYPINRTEFSNDFHTEKGDLQFEFYQKPNEATKMHDETGDLDVAGSTASVNRVGTLLPPKACRPPRIFNSTEWLLAQNTEPQRSASEIALEAQQHALEVDAVRTIWHAWCRYKLRRRLKARERQQLKFLGTLQDFGNSTEANIELTAHLEARRARKQQLDTEHQKLIAAVEAKVAATKSCCLEETAVDHVREWYHEMYAVAHEFQEFPSAEKGGSAAILLGESMTIAEFLDYLRQRDEKQKNGAGGKQKEATKKDNKKAAESKAKKSAAPPGWDFSSPKFATVTLQTLVDTLQSYDRDLRSIDCHIGANDAPNVEMIEIDAYAKVHGAVRETVDTKMRLEMEDLQKAWCSDVGKKYKKKKEKKPKTKHKKVRIVEPLTVEVAAQMFDELVSNAVLFRHPIVSLDDLITDHNYAAFELRLAGVVDPHPGGVEMKQLLRLHFFGMGPFDIDKPKAICLAGPAGSGKMLLVHAMASEIDAVILHLTADTIRPFQDDIPRFIDVIKKMAKHLEPSIIHVDGAHKPFAKKLPPDDEPFKSIGKYLPAIVKSIRAEDKVMLVGTTNEPWSGNAKAMKKTFGGTQWLCPSNDYGATYQLWREGIGRKLGRDVALCSSALAKVTTGYTAHAILTSIDRVLDEKRIRRLHFRLLEPSEFLHDLTTNASPIDSNQLEKYRTWFGKVNPLEKARIAHQKALLQPPDSNKK